MNALDKIKNVQNGLTCCSSIHSCNRCPYKGTEGCSGQKDRDALEVINALKAELEKRTNKVVEAKPGFIVLTNGILYTSEGRSVIMTNNGKIAVRVDDIFSVKDLGEVGGSEVRLNDARQTAYYVCETLEEILGKVADVKGE